MGDFPALELVHAANPLADKPELGRVHTSGVDRGIEDIGKHAPIRGVRAPKARLEQRDLVVRGPLNQGTGDRSTARTHCRRPRGSLAFQAFVALHTAVDVVDVFALFPDQLHAVDAAVALIEQGHIVDKAIGLRDPHKPQGPLAHAEHGEKLFARRRHRCHAHQSAEHSGHEYTPPLVLTAHTLLLHKGWLSSRPHASIAGGGGLAQCTETSITVTDDMLCAMPMRPARRLCATTTHGSEPLAPNAAPQPRPEAEAT